MSKRPSGTGMAALQKVLYLDTVQYFELAGRAIAGFEGPEPGTEGMDDDDVSLRLQPAIRLRPDGLDVRCRLMAKTIDGAVIVDAAAFYTVSDEGALPAVSDTVARRFADQIATPDLLPYLRQAVDDLSVRLLPQRIVIPPIPSGAVDYKKVDVIREEAGQSQ